MPCRNRGKAAFQGQISIMLHRVYSKAAFRGADTHHDALELQQGSIPGADTHHDALELQQHSTLGAVADQVPIPRNHDLNVMEHSIPQADAYPTDYAAIYARDARIIRGLVYHVYQTMALHRVIPFYDACNKYDQIMTAILPTLDTLRDHADERCRPLMKDLYESLVQLRRLLREWVADPEVEAVRYKRDALRLIVKIRERLHDMENITFDERVLPFD